MISVEKRLKKLLVEARGSDLPFARFYGAALALFFLGALLGVAVHGDLPRALTSAWWSWPAGKWPLIPPTLKAHLTYALYEILPKNALVLLVAGGLLPWVGKTLLGDPWPARTYVLVLAFATGLMATPGGLPHGGSYLLVLAPVAALELLAYAMGAWEGVRAAREGRLPALSPALLTLILAALVETEAVAWFL